ncbi:DNA-binding CsgD family transcriptional regulator [Brevibacterium epidermidis]|jgi:DNA-binding CsgD family transcriptional regulator|uniref:DNA-binding CsgD family transcriptional regulator n=1 Tax=Brevibacterium epidermidis TaxID=1698 RepID=A0ABV4EJ60_BREEP
MAYFSRTEELTAIIDHIRPGHGSSVVLIGSRGLGKTTLVKALLDDEFPTTLVTVNAAESTWQYSGLTAYLGAIDAAVGSDLLATVYRTGLDGEPFDVAKTIGDILRRADLGEQLVVIDDADEMDTASQQVLGYVMRRKVSPRVRHVLTVDNLGDDSAFSGMLSTTLEPLSARTLIRIGRENQPPTTSYVVLDFVARASDGNPLIFESILGQLSAQELGEDVPLSVPLNPGTVLTERVSRELSGISESAREALNVLSCGLYVPLALVDEIEALSAEGVEELIENGLVTRTDLTLRIDCSVAAVVYWGLHTAHRLDTHRLLAQLSGERFPGICAWHTSFFEPDAKLVDTMLEHSVTLLQASFTNGAVEFVDRALGMTDGSHGEQLVKVATGFFVNGEYDLARRCLRFASGPQLTAEARLDGIILLVFLDYMQFQTISPRQIEATVSEFQHSHPNECTRLLCEAAIIYLDLWEYDKAQALLDRAQSMGGSNPGVLTAATVILQWYRAVLKGSPLPEVPVMAEQANQVRPAYGESLATLVMARTLTLAERYDDAREILGEFLQFPGVKARLWSDVAMHSQYANEIGAGRHHRAREIADVIRADQGSRRYFEIATNLMRATLEAVSRDFATAGETLQETAKLLGAGQSKSLEARLASGQGRLALMTQEFDTAVGLFARASRFGRDLENPQLLRIHEDYVEVLLLAGRKDDAVAVAEDLRRRAATAPSEWAHLVLKKLDAQLLDGEESIAAFEQVIAEGESGNHQYTRARTMLAFATRLKELGYDRRSIEVLQDAKALMEVAGVDIGNKVFVSTPDYESNMSVLELLDEKELPVVRLLVRGLKNRSIANELYVSVRTVELRLTSIYRKAGVKSRFELLRLVSEQEEFKADADESA